MTAVVVTQVEITDINDNPPLFDRQEYKENVKQDTPKGANILRVSASDEDADNNGAIEYQLAGQSSDFEYFEINPESGWISLRKDLTNVSHRTFVLSCCRTRKQTLILLRQTRTPCGGKVLLFLLLLLIFHLLPAFDI